MGEGRFPSGTGPRFTSGSYMSICLQDLLNLRSPHASGDWG